MYYESEVGFVWLPDLALTMKELLYVMSLTGTIFLHVAWLVWNDDWRKMKTDRFNQMFGIMLALRLQLANVICVVLCEMYSCFYFTVSRE